MFVSRKKFFAPKNGLKWYNILWKIISKHLLCESSANYPNQCHYCCCCCCWVNSKWGVAIKLLDESLSRKRVLDLDNQSMQSCFRTVFHWLHSILLTTHGQLLPSNAKICYRSTTHFRQNGHIFSFRETSLIFLYIFTAKKIDGGWARSRWKCEK